MGLAAMRAACYRPWPDESRKLYGVERIGVTPGKRRTQPLL